MKLGPHVGLLPSDSYTLKIGVRQRADALDFLCPVFVEVYGRIVGWFQWCG